MKVVWTRSEALLGELTDAAYPVLVRHGVQGSSVDLEVEVGRAIAGVLDGPESGPGVFGFGARREMLAEAAVAAYQVGLQRGFTHPFPDVELDLWRAMCRAVL
jgi:hypothetical protein